jgi:hypothetical protein
LDGTNTWYTAGTLDYTAAYYASGIIVYSDRAYYYPYGTLDANYAYEATGIVDSNGVRYDLTYAHTTAGGTLTYPAGSVVKIGEPDYGIGGNAETPSYDPPLGASTKQAVGPDTISK